MKNGFILTSEESELLLHFEERGTIEKTAKALNKDASGVSRMLSGVARKYPAIEKRGGKWFLTETGKKLNDITRNSIQLQRSLLLKQEHLRLGTNREFGARVLSPHILTLSQLLQDTTFSIYTFEYGVEEAILSGKIDIGVDCGRPYDPDILYKHAAEESIVAVCTPQFLEENKDVLSRNFCRVPHLLYERLYPDILIAASKNNEQKVAAYFNDIASARSACIAGFGWAFLPKYTVREELDLKQTSLHSIYPSGTLKIRSLALKKVEKLVPGRSILLSIGCDLRAYSKGV